MAIFVGAMRTARRKELERERMARAEVRGNRPSYLLDGCTSRIQAYEAQEKLWEDLVRICCSGIGLF
jgi:hypothetical protein